MFGKKRIKELEKKNKELNEKIVELCMNPDSEKSLLIKEHIKFWEMAKKGMYYGEPTCKNETKQS